MPEIKFAPREIFEQILEWAVIPTFDLVIEYGNRGIIMVLRTIPPYQHQWALPGLRMYKGEEINDTIFRVAFQELGLKVNPSTKIFLGQCTGKFKTEHNRQDISTGYLLRVPSSQKIVLNQNHFSEIRFITKESEIPKRCGAMYKFYVGEYFKERT